jgi:hypothetical protein
VVVRRAVLLAVLVAAVGLAVIAAGRVEEPEPAFTIAYDRDDFAATRRVPLGDDHPPVELHRLRVALRCDEAGFEWYSSNLEPTRADTEAVVELVVDGTVRASAVVGGQRGVFADSPAWLRWHDAVGRGEHDVVVRLRGRGAFGDWGVPYVTPDRPGQDTLLVVDRPPPGARPDAC